MTASITECIHAIMVPFGIRDMRAGKEDVHLDAVAAVVLKHGPWQAGRAPPAVPESAGPWNPRLSDYQRQHYFHPFVQRFQLDNSLIRHFHRTDFAKLKACFDHSTTENFEITFDVIRCELVLYQPDVGILLLELQCSNVSLDRIQVVLDSLRRLYPPYFDFWPSQIEDKAGAKHDRRNWRGGHCVRGVVLLSKADEPLDASQCTLGEQTGEAASEPAFADAYLAATAKRVDNHRLAAPLLAQHWRALLAPLSGPAAGTHAPSFSSVTLGDDRAATMSWLATPYPRGISEGDYVRLALADDPGDSKLPYSQSYLANFAERYCYDRFWYQGLCSDSGTSPSRLMNSGYAFTWVGSSEDPAYFMNARNGAMAIFRGAYIEMGLIAHFQKAALQCASQRLTEMVHRTPAGRIKMPQREAVLNFYEHFVEFTQNFWFDEISPQDQGRDLFDMWRRHLRIQPLYDEVHQELKDLVAYTELTNSRRLNVLITWLGGLSLVISYLALIASTLAIDASKLPQAPALITGSLNDALVALAPSVHWLLALAPIGVVAAAVVALVAWLYGRRRRTAP